MISVLLTALTGRKIFKNTPVIAVLTALTARSREKNLLLNYNMLMTQPLTVYCSITDVYGFLLRLMILLTVVYTEDGILKNIKTRTIFFISFLKFHAILSRRKKLKLTIFEKISFFFVSTIIFFKNG